MAEGRLTFDQRELILKCQVQRQRRREFLTEPKSRLTILRFRKQCDSDITMQHMHEQPFRKPRSWSGNILL